MYAWNVKRNTTNFFKNLAFLKIKKYDLEASYNRNRPPQNVSFLSPGDHDDGNDDYDVEDDKHDDRDDDDIVDDEADDGKSMQLSTYANSARKKQ